VKKVVLKVFASFYEKTLKTLTGILFRERQRAYSGNPLQRACSGFLISA
jgi:hypothetical protein